MTPHCRTNCGRRASLLGVFALLVVSVCSAQHRSLAEEPGSTRGAQDEALASRVDKLFAKWNKPDSPGCAIGIVRDGELILARGYGMANLDDGVAITPQTVFEVGSVTKSVTCACIALLLDEGKISADDDIRKFIPDLPPYDPPITIRNIIRCECGLPDYFHLLQIAGWNIDDAYTNQDVLALLSRWKTTAFKPGEKFAYTSSGYFLLSQLVQRVTGQSLARFAEERLFKPLEMTATYYDDDPTRVVPHRAVGYNVIDGGRIRRWNMNSNTVGGWGLKSTVEDLVRWDQNFSRNKLTEGKHINELFTEGALLGNRNVLDAIPTGEYRGVRRIQFTGGMPGFAAALVRFPDQRFTVVCLSNDNWRVSPWGLAAQIADLFLESQFKQPAPKRESAPAKTVSFVSLPEQDLREYVGGFRLPSGRVWRISLAGGKLVLTDDRGDEFPLGALDATRFRETRAGTDTTLVFTRTKRDTPPELHLEGDNGGTTRLKRIELVQPTPEQLAEYVGAYDSDELGTWYYFSERDGQLYLRINNRRHERLVPQEKDVFTPHEPTEDDNRIVTFTRDGNNRITGLTIDLWRVTGVRFIRHME